MNPITPTIRSEIKKENERQKQYILQNREKLRKIYSDFDRARKEKFKEMFEQRIQEGKQ